MIHTSYILIVLICCCVPEFGCGDAAPNSTPKNRDSGSDSGATVDTNRSTESASGSETETVPDDTFTTDPHCIHPKVIKSFSNGWCKIPPGCFTIGSPEDEMGHGMNSEVQNQITLTHAFEIQQYEVTQGQWAAAGFTDPSNFGPNGNGLCAASDCPVESINWYEAVAFANRMSELHEPSLPACYTMENCTGDVGTGMICETVTVNAPSIYECEGYRLPTVYEWEYAARAGTQTAFYSGDITNYENPVECNVDMNLDRIGWYCINSEDRTHPMGQKEPNAWGLCDMAGNVSEWVDSKFNGLGYGFEPVSDPIGPTDATDRLLRGGAWTGSPMACRSGKNYPLPPELFSHDSGTRLVRTL
jgi:formylglycine-generating enzyme required for sulfatase activity